MLLAQEIIRAKRDGQALSEAQIQAFVRGLVDGSWSEAQVAAMAMAVFQRGMGREECVQLTRAMMHSGRTLSWPDMPGPVLDKHSTGGVGDKVSLMSAPLIAACGGFVPMISGRGLGHTGGTRDKFDAIPGYNCTPTSEQLSRVVREAGCAVIGQTGDLAPADGRLYAIRDVTATVENVQLITASILSKKLAAGLQGLVMDVKCGNGAFADSLQMAEDLARSIVEVANGAGLPTRALITDMNQVLGREVGNALEMDEAEARRRLQQALDSGAAAERFARMVAGLGGPADLLERPAHYLAAAPVRRPVPALRSGVVSAMRTRDIGLAVVELGGGRRQASDSIDARVGFSGMRGLGDAVQAGEALAWVHAADEAAAERAVAQLQAACCISDAPLPFTTGDVVLARLS